MYIFYFMGYSIYQMLSLSFYWYHFHLFKLLHLSLGYTKTNNCCCSFIMQNVFTDMMTDKISLYFCAQDQEKSFGSMQLHPNLQIWCSLYRMCVNIGRCFLVWDYIRWSGFTYFFRWKIFSNIKTKTSSSNVLVNNPAKCRLQN